MTITNKTQKIEIDGKEYISTSLFLEHFYYGSPGQVSHVIKQGLPHIRKHNKNWFNKEQCHKWYAGVK